MNGQWTDQTVVNICGIPLPREPHYSNSILKLLKTCTGEL